MVCYYINRWSRALRCRRSYTGFHLVYLLLQFLHQLSSQLSFTTMQNKLFGMQREASSMVNPHLLNSAGFTFEIIHVLKSTDLHRGGPKHSHNIPTMHQELWGFMYWHYLLCTLPHHQKYSGMVWHEQRRAQEMNQSSQFHRFHGKSHPATPLSTKPVPVLVLS